MKIIICRSLYVSAVLLFCCLGAARAQLPTFAQPVQISGQVRYPNGTPAFDILVRLDEQTGGSVGESRTDRLGKFIFKGLVPRQYRVTVRHPGFREIDREVNLIIQFADYIQLTLIPDPKTPPAVDMVNPPGLVDANIPLEAQNEYSKAKEIIDGGKADKMPEAISHLEKAITLHPGYLAANLMLGFAYMDLREWSKAEKPLLAATKINSGASTAFIALGDVYRREKKYSEAEAVLLEGLKINGNSAEGHNTLAKVYWDMAPATKTEEKFKEALSNSWREVKKALELNPAMADAHLLSGDLLMKARRADAALVHFEEYLKLDPKGEFAESTKVLVAKIKQALAQSGQKTGN